jgi:hypothetical protein
MLYKEVLHKKVLHNRVLLFKEGSLTRILIAF